MFLEHMTEARGEAVHVCARILLKYTLNVDEENKVGGKLQIAIMEDERDGH